MASKVNRGFMFYFFLFFGIVLGAFITCIVIMIFVPDFSLFGLRVHRENYNNVRVINMSVYSDENDTEENSSVLMSNSSYQIDNIEIDATINSVRVLKTNGTDINETQFALIFNSNNFVFTTNEVNLTGLYINYYEDSNTLKIGAIGPEGFINFGNSSLTLQIPQDYSTGNINLTINSKKSVYVGDNQGNGNTLPSTLNLKTINIQTEDSIHITEYVTIGTTTNKGDCSLVSKRGDISVNTPIIANNLEIETGEGYSYFNEDAQSFNVSGNIEINTNSTFVYLGEVYCLNNIYLKNQYGKFYFKKSIVGNVFINKDSEKCDYEFESDMTGDLAVGSYLDELMVEGGSLVFKGYIIGEASISMTGDVRLKGVIRAQIKNTNGNVVIEEPISEIKIRTVDGNVSLGSDEARITSSIDVESTGKGKVLAYFQSFGASENSRIVTNSGDIEIYLIKNIAKDITAETTGNLNYLGVDIKGKAGTWQNGTSKALEINSKGNIVIKNKVA